eukprot:CAMPEP_0170348010 /NCGR_PEP_ID=MMETSP0116_2-20130129/75271_1 /TAXON_ID=400756 /ORGANISM="Durinskia baltica, Strain CSIRO CS-38" /LENGTH=445 /DNA_ID=CAMNT_0010601845 /DNA_START=101 /DNA_END=1438 /DNA_ORIENTATION=+
MRSLRTSLGLAVFALSTTASLAFQSPVVTLSSRGVRPTVSRTARHAVPVEFLHEIQAQLQSLPHVTTGVNVDSVLDSTSLQLLADAAADTATKDDGWWAAYLNIFKTCLLFVHNTIDAPLRSVGVTQTWGVAIAIFTALKPYMTEIREKFKDNKDAQNRAIAKLYEDANQNPLAGCLVSLAQLPIFLGLYRGVRLLAIDGELDEPFLFIPSLQGPVSAESDYRGLDWLLQGWQQTADGGWVPSLGWETTLAFMVMPVVLVLGQSLSMRILTPPIDDSMGKEEREQMEKSQVILKFLPLLIGFFSLQVPAGLTIYWFTSNFFTLAQSLAVRAYYKANPPQIELPDYWDALEDLDNMSPEDKRKAAEAGISVGPKWEDLLDEARFHVVVDRQPLRENSPTWQRLMATSSDPTSIPIPAEFQAWVGTPSKDPINNNRTELEPATSLSN